MSLRERWANGDTTLGAWLSSGDPVVAEAVARAGFDYVCVDQQHGTAGYRELVTMVQAIELGGNIPITRVTWNDPGLIGRALDAGAHGVIVPMVNTRTQAEAVVRACRYAPDGARSFGPVMPGMRRGEHLEWARQNVTVIPIIETVEALDNLDDILSVEGVDAIYVGPADLSLTLGLPPGNNDGDTSFAGALATIVERCAHHNVPAGIHSTGPVTPRRLAQGFSMVTVTSDLLAMTIGLRSELAAATQSDDETSTDSLY